MRTAFEKRFYSIFVVFFFIIVYLLYFIVSRSNISCIAIDILGVLKRCMTTEFGGTRHKVVLAYMTLWDCVKENMKTLKSLDCRFIYKN